jgi:RNA polymerase sigma-70 factor, ECF subfamily
MVLSSEAVRQALLVHLPNLRAFAMSLCHDKHDADDLLQETMLKAWNNLESFKEGTNLRAWLFTIMRNTHFSHYRKKRTQLIDEGTEALAQIGVPPTQIDSADARHIEAALQQLNTEQREAIILVAAEGFNYEEAAAISNCPVGTIKSRLNRARSRLAEILGIRSADDFTSSNSYMK